MFVLHNFDIHDPNIKQITKSVLKMLNSRCQNQMHVWTFVETQFWNSCYLGKTQMISMFKKDNIELKYMHNF